MQQVCHEQNIEPETAMQRLAAHGMRVSQDALISTIAAEAGLRSSAVISLITGDDSQPFHQ